ncbi:putative membrane protein [Desulfosporosinus sp. OT]|nr:putative membrane protein [Desulfosporosinus sp. OT]
MKRETLFLKVVVLLLGIPVLALCLFGLPSIALEAAEHYPVYWVYPVMIGMYVAAFPFTVLCIRLLNF